MGPSLHDSEFGSGMFGQHGWPDHGGPCRDNRPDLSFQVHEEHSYLRRFGSAGSSRRRIFRSGRDYSAPAVLLRS